MPDKDIDKIPITVEVPKADVWVRNDYRDIVRRLGEVHMIRACEHQHDDDFVPLYDIETLARYQIELEQLRAENYSLQAAILNALPGVRYMDPPDGGSPSLAEQLRRMATDAERYRWLRGDSCMDHSARWTQWEVRRWDAPIWTNDLRRADLDAAIDDAMRKETEMRK